MIIPGQNILNMALTIISRQSIVYYRYIGRIQNSVGQDVTHYQNGQIITGSFQPVPRKMYFTLGLDLQKDYYTFYTSNPILDVGRDISGDQISFNNQRFQCESDNDWYALDGWKGVLCVHIGNDTQAMNIFGLNESNQNFLNGNFMSDGEIDVFQPN